MTILQNEFIATHAVASGHVELPEKAATLGAEGVAIQGLQEGQGGWSNIGQKEGAANGICGGMDDKGTITIVATTVIAAELALAADGAFLVALGVG